MRGAPVGYGEGSMLTDRAKPAARRHVKVADKPPMPAIMKASAAKAIKRHQQRLLSPGVAVEVVKVGEPYVVASPHQDSAAWEAMVCDALGTRSVSTAQTFLYQLTELCSQSWHPVEIEGEDGRWCPDEGELNMVLNIVAGIKPKNEMEAALAAQMVAVHLMQMRLSASALSGVVVAPQDAAIAGKLARTFVMQIEALSRLKGRRSISKQTITVRQEKHVHHHQHVHVGGGGSENRAQPHASGQAINVTRPIDGAGDAQERASLPSPNTRGKVVSLRCHEGKAGLSNARGEKSRRATG